MRAAAILLFASLLAAAPAAADDAAPPAPRTEKQMALLRKAVLDGLADPDAAACATAAELVVAAWPESAVVLDEALASRNAGVRLEAVRLLARPELGDVKDRIRRKFDDASEPVRRLAIRAARRLVWPEAEKNYVDAVTSDPVWSVRQEALRALEDRGTWKCLRVVFDGWLSESDVDHKRRYKRALLAVLKTDHGDDVDAWRAAVDGAESKGREATSTSR